MAFTQLPPGSSYRVCRKLIRNMFSDLYSNPITGANDYLQLEPQDGTTAPINSLWVRLADKQLMFKKNDGTSGIVMIT